MKTVREWVNFLKDEPNTTFAIEDIHGIESRIYLSPEEFLKRFEGFGKWLDAIPVKIYYNNNHKGGTLFIVKII